MKTLTLMALLSLAITVQAADKSISLVGQWRFQIDRADAGMGEAWFDRTLPDKIKLPGGLTEQGAGDPVTVDTKWTGGIVDKSWFTAPEYAKYREPGNVKVPFWLQPELYYAGSAWFQREIEIPKDWDGRRVVLFLERAHWETWLWLDGHFIGTNHSLSTPHEYNLGPLEPGKHTVTIRVDNRRIVNIGENSHGVSDHTQGNWNGIVGRVELQTQPLVWIEDLQVYPRVEKRTFRIKAHIRNPAGQPGIGTLSLDLREVTSPRMRSPAHFRPLHLGIPSFWAAPDTDVSWEAPPEDVPGLEPWSEFSPRLYQLTVTLPNGASQSATFGLREVSTDDTQITINGHKTFIRGTLECAIFPKTGHPPTDVDEWKRIIGVAKSCGLNLIRCHSYCPPEAAFQAADELGMYLQIETCWPNQSTTLGDGKPVDQWVYDETDRILKYYGNHPSFLLMSPNNEPGGNKANAFLAKYVNHYKTLDPRRLWTSGSGWPQLPENQFHVTPDPRIQGWDQGLTSRINAQPPETTTDYRDYIAQRSVPVISHEIGQWCAYPNFAEIPKYTGYLKPRNFEIFRARLEANGLGTLAKPFLLASGKLQTLCYKEDIESALRTPGMGGFELLDLHDFPGQGTALVGVLDPFWEEKGYVTAAEYNRFCNSTVPLVRLKKRVFTTDEELEAEIQVAHYGPEVAKRAVIQWKLVASDGKLIADGKLAPQDLSPGKLNALASLSIPLHNVRAPRQCKLFVRIEHPGSQTAENDWDLWVYPALLPEELSDVRVTSIFDEAAQTHLQSGGKLLLTIPGQQVRNFDTAPVKLGFSSIFWNTAWTGRQPPTTLGILCDPKHPALAEFPTEFHSNWQWWYLIHRAGALRLDTLPTNVEPIVRVIDDWVTARSLGLVVEGKVGTGRIVICGFDLTQTDAADAVSRQMRASLLHYMGSSKFKPRAVLGAEQIKSLQSEPTPARP